MADVASHNKPDNLWVVIDEDVYDLTNFQDDHPGGKKSKDRCTPLFGFTLIAELLKRLSSPPAGWRKRRVEAILEIPQPSGLEAIQRKVTGRLP